MTADQQGLLDRVKYAVGRVEKPVRDTGHPGTFRGYAGTAGRSARDLAAAFERELSALSGHPHLVADADAAGQKVVDILRAQDCRRILAWEAASPLLQRVEAELAHHAVEILRVDLGTDPDDRRRQLAAVEDVRVGLTGARAALADSGGVVLTSGPGRARLASLLPPVHIAVVRAADLHPNLPAFLAADPEAVAAGSNLVIVTGPSRTADIEMTLSIGVHGPGEIHVIVVGGEDG